MRECDIPDCDTEKSEDKRWLSLGEYGSSVILEPGEQSIYYFCSFDCLDYGREVWARRHFQGF